MNATSNLGKVLEELKKLNLKKIFNEHYKSQEECRKKGHPGEKVINYNSQKATCICTTCGDAYVRGVTCEEQAKWYKTIRTPKDI